MDCFRLDDHPGVEDLQSTLPRLIGRSPADPCHTTVLGIKCDLMPRSAHSIPASILSRAARISLGKGPEVTEKKMLAPVTGRLESDRQSLVRALTRMFAAKLD